MTGVLDQKNRVAQLTTDLGPNYLVLRSFAAHEGMSELFDFSVEALSEEDNIDFDPIMGRNCVVKLNLFDTGDRFFNGVLVDAGWTGVHDGFYSYRLTLRPWLWLLSKRVDCRFFQEISIPDIIKKVFSDAGFADHDFRLTATYKPIEYCVQYRETDFAFVSRLMEEFGIFYYFEHTETKHTLVLADFVGAHKALDCGDLPFVPITGGYQRDDEHLYHWTAERRFRSGRFTVEDYNFETPNAAMEASAQAAEPYPSQDYEIYDFPTRHREHGGGEFFAKVRRDAEQSADRRRIANGDAASIYPGAKVTMKGHYADAENGDYVAVRASHMVSEQHYRTTPQAGAAGKAYHGSYVLTPFDRPFRPPHVTPKPVIHGVQTAKIVCEPGEEITVDKYGRVKVQFYWDRQDKQSCWIRVAEVWASKSWGGVFHPRIGQEVVVAFLEGDPDRPLIVGTLYNADNMPPYDLPDKKTVGGIKSNSTKGGGGYNEFVFDDLKGSEKIRMHGEKDHEVVIRNSEKRNIGEAFTPPRGAPAREVTIENGDDKLTVAAGCQQISVTGDRTINVTGMHSETVTMTSSTTVTGPMSITAMSTLTVTATATLTLVCGGSTIVMTPAGIIITAPSIMVNGTTLLNGTGPKPIPWAGAPIAVP